MKKITSRSSSLSLMRVKFFSVLATPFVFVLNLVFEVWLFVPFIV